MDVRRYEELKEKVEGLRREAAKAEGQYDTFMARMKKDYDVETLDEAGERLLGSILKIASGAKTKAETINYQDPIELYFQGPSL